VYKSHEGEGCQEDKNTGWRLTSDGKKGARHSVVTAANQLQNGGGTQTKKSFAVMKEILHGSKSKSNGGREQLSRKERPEPYSSTGKKNSEESEADDRKKKSKQKTVFVKKGWVERAAPFKSSQKRGS